MALRLIDAVYTILDKVEKETGKPIRFVQNNCLETYAGLRMARKSMTEHIIVYKAEHDKIINHLIAHECGHVFRMFGVREEKRLIPYTDDKIKSRGLSEIETEIQKLSKILPIEELGQIVNMWYTGIIRQLTNYPSDIVIEKWIYDEYPTLRTIQLESIQKQLADALYGLKETVKQITPPRIFDASNIMNYVFFRILGLHFGTNFIKPYSNTPYVNRGKALASIMESKRLDSYEADVIMVNTWADFLHLSNWFQWTGFENVPDNYIMQE